MTESASAGPSSGCPPPYASPSRPNFRLPTNSCDSHFHIWGPASIFPFAESRTFTPVDVPKEKVMALHDYLGFQRGVIVHSACHGSNHNVLLDALSAAPGRYRGVALLDQGTSDDEIRRLDAAGVCGFRLHFMPHIAPPPSREYIDGLLAKVADLGWHAEIHVGGNGVAEHADLIRSLPVPVVIDHMARLDLSEGQDSRAVHALLDLLASGSVWVKLSGIDRLSKQGPPYDDSVAFARRLLLHAPDRVLWGTDFPHPNIVGDAPDDGLLVNRIPDIAEDDPTISKLLVTNPAKFFGFPP